MRMEEVVLELVGHLLKFQVNVGVQQGSVHTSPFMMVLQALSQGFRVGCPWELLYADDRVLIYESMDELIEKFTRCKEGIELRVKCVK